MSNGTDIQSFNKDDHGFSYRTDKNKIINEQTGNHTANSDVDCFPLQDKQLVKNSTSNGTYILSFNTDTDGHGFNYRKTKV